MDNFGLGTILKKLYREESDWVLEIERLVPLGRHLHQPVPQKIEGAELIGRHMRAVPDLLEMAAATEELMKDESAASAYGIWQGRWFEEDMVDNLSMKRKAGTTAGAMSVPGGGGASKRAVAKLERLQKKLAERMEGLEQGNVGALAGEMAKMAGLISSFADRMEAIESKLGLETPAAVESAAAAPAASAQSTPATTSESVPVTATPPEPAPAVAPSEPSASPATPEASAAAEQPQDSPEESAAAEVLGPDEEDGEKKPAKRMRPPSVVAMRQSLSMLLGEEVGLTEQKKRVSLTEGNYFRCLVNDDDGLLVGVMIADLEATIQLACKLMMLPDAEKQSQLDSGEASEDSVETMSEIFNTMSAAVNNVKTNPHVRTTPLARLETEEFDWLDTTKRRIDVEVEGGGVIVICAI